jgi:hypothetical protein
MADLEYFLHMNGALRSVVAPFVCLAKLAAETAKAGQVLYTFAFAIWIGSSWESSPTF